jgi:GAF domain-containing protein
MLALVARSWTQAALLPVRVGMTLDLAESRLWSVGATQRLSSIGAAMAMYLSNSPEQRDAIYYHLPDGRILHIQTVRDARRAGSPAVVDGIRILIGSKPASLYESSMQWLRDRPGRKVREVDLCDFE